MNAACTAYPAPPWWATLAAVTTPSDGRDRGRVPSPTELVFGLWSCPHCGQTQRYGPPLHVCPGPVGSTPCPVERRP